MNEGITLYKQGKFPEALRHFKSMETEVGDEVSYYLGLCYAKLEQQDEALACLDAFIAHSDDFSQIYQARMVIGFLYASTGRYRLAEFEFQRLLDEGYESSKVRAALGYIFFQQGNVPASIQNLEKARVLDPKNPTALNSLAFIMANEKIQISLALKYARQALLIRPKNPAYLDTLGWVLFKNGEIKKAAQVLRKAVELAPGRTEIRKHWEEVEMATGAMQ